MFQVSRIVLIAGLIISQALLQDIIQQLSKPNNYYGDVAPLIARMQAEASAQPPAQIAPQPSAPQPMPAPPPVPPMPGGKSP